MPAFEHQCSMLTVCVPISIMVPVVMHETELYLKLTKNKQRLISFTIIHFTHSHLIDYIGFPKIASDK